MKAVNLLPSDNRGGGAAAQPAKAPSTGGPASGAYALIGVLALAVVMAVAYVLVDNSVKERQAELESTKAELTTVQAQAAALKPYADFKQMAEQRVTTVKDIARSRFDWERSLRDVSRALPANVHLKSLKGTVSSSAGGGLAIRQGIIAPAIELAGCTTSQSAVARLMSRLRSVRGVTRVSLQKSEKTDQVGNAAASGGEAPLCGKGAPPAFEVVMFFERATTGVTATPVPGQPAAPGQASAGGTQPAQSGQPAATPTPASGSTSQGVSNP